VKRNLTDQEVGTLVEIVLRRGAEESPLVTALRNGGLTDEQVDELGDLVTEELAANGFDADYEPTPYGVKLEDVIDVLSDA
jgi:hypothetical protein